MQMMIPKEIALDHTISPRARLLYGHLCSLSYKNGYCWASNAALAKDFGVGWRSIVRDIVELEEKALLRVERDRHDTTNTKRRIYPVGTVKSDRTPPVKSDRPPLSDLTDNVYKDKYTSKKGSSESKLTKASLLAVVRELAKDAATAKRKASPEINQVVAEVFGSWREAGHTKSDQWSFKQHDLHKKYLSIIGGNV